MGRVVGGEGGWVRGVTLNAFLIGCLAAERGDWREAPPPCNIIELTSRAATMTAAQRETTELVTPEGSTLSKTGAAALTGIAVNRAVRKTRLKALVDKACFC